MTGLRDTGKCPRTTPQGSPRLARRVRRILHSGDPRGDEYREALAWVQNVRSRLAHIRGELEDIGRIECAFEHDSIAHKVAGTLTLTLMALHELVEGDRSFGRRAEALDALWGEVAADPDGFVIKDGESRKWRPWGIFKRGGPDRALDLALLDLLEAVKQTPLDLFEAEDAPEEAFRAASAIRSALRRIEEAQDA